jgi:hypothetical protein
MILSSVCQPWQPERAANAAQEQRSYNTSWGTISIKRCGLGKPNLYELHIKATKERRGGRMS